MLWIGGELVVIWQPVQLEREITIGARAWVVKHLSTSHHNVSHDPAGSHYFTTLGSHGNQLVARMIIAARFRSTETDVNSKCLRTIESPISLHTVIYVDCAAVRKDQVIGPD